jgi:hypothetical protein
MPFFSGLARSLGQNNEEQFGAASATRLAGAWGGILVKLILGNYGKKTVTDVIFEQNMRNQSPH